MKAMGRRLALREHFVQNETTRALEISQQLLDCDRPRVAFGSSAELFPTAF